MYFGSFFKYLVCLPICQLLQPVRRKLIGDIRFVEYRHEVFSALGSFLSLNLSSNVSASYSTYVYGAPLLCQHEACLTRLLVCHRLS